MGSSFHESIVINSHVDEGTQYMMTSSSSSEEEEKEELAGVGRWYECVFCKRGFNTAQALGGHMNIHRKHRPSSSSRTCTTTNIITINPPPPPPPRTINNNNNHHHQQNYEKTASTSSFYTGNNNDEYRQPSSDHPIVVPPDNWRLRLSLEFSPMNIVEEDNLEIIKNNKQVMNQKDELDLELRLGYSYDS